MGCSWVAHGLLMGLSWDALGELYPQGHEFAMKKGCEARDYSLVVFVVGIESVTVP